MDKEQKAATIEEIAAQIEGADAILAVDYRGISVPQAAELRGKLREADASFRVVKNRLTKLAAEKAGEDRLAELLEGPTALTFVRGDTATAAKAISTFNKEHEVLAFKGGFMDGLTLDEEKFTSIARLPSRDVLNGQFAGVVASPLTGLVRGLGSMIQGLALQLGQIAEKGLVSGEAPADQGAGPVAEESDADTPATETEERRDAEGDGTSETASQSDSSPSSEEEQEPEQSEENPPAAEAELSTPAESDGEAESPSEEESQSDSSTTSEGDESSDTENEKEE
jgi:large subunit ribosomal protein L10